ncbi:MAG TPA: hypothetical protein VNP95_08055 [Thermomicrobiales bacterium]|nr:hypothetical protein [Thermomicrobiales bacterium]
MIVRVETADGGDLPAGIQACVEADCRPLGLLASLAAQDLRLPSGSGVIFSDVSPAAHQVSVRDADAIVLDARSVTVGGDVVTVVFVIQSEPVVTVTPATPPEAATVPITSLPQTGQGSGRASGTASLLVAMLVMAAGSLVMGIGLRKRCRLTI